MSSLLHSVLNSSTERAPCRLCLRSDGDDWSHLDRSLRVASLRVTLSLRALLNTLRHTQVYNDNNLPQNVCDSCVNAALQSLIFWKKCDESEKRWKMLANHLYKSTMFLQNQLKSKKLVDTTNKPVYVFKDGDCKEIILPLNVTASEIEVCNYLNFTKPVDDYKIGCDLDDGAYDHYDNECELDSKHLKKRKKNKKDKTKSAEDKYSCALCSLNFIKKQYLTTHWKTKHNIFQKVECNDCNRKFNSMYLLRKHVSVHRTANVYKCSICQQVFSLAVQLESHITGTHHEKKFQCQECPELFQRMSEAKKHQMNVHDSGHENICKQCGKKYQSLARLLNHEGKHKGIICEKCGKRFSYPYKLKEHSDKCVSKNEDMVMRCLHCPNVFKHKSELRKHCTDSHKTDLVHVCETCNRTFSSAARLKCHVSRHTGVVCERCGRHFKYQSQLRTHKNICLKERKPGNPRPSQQPIGPPQFICDHCGKDFYFKESLKAHIKSQHLFHNIYKCDFCDRRFSYKGGLKSHLIVHTKERSEQCNICGKYFVTKPALVYHMRLHTGERPFACDICDEKFLSASRRMAHIRTKHWGRTEECTVCSSKFYTPYAMRKHMSRHFNPNSKLFFNKTVNEPYAQFNVD